MNERRKKLQETMKLFNKSQKNEILGFGNEAEKKEVIATGITSLDNFIGGGTKRGTFTVLYGGQSVGKSTLVLQAIAKAQKEDRICCYIDLEHTFDKDRAISLGIDLDSLILAEKCENAERPLKLLEHFVSKRLLILLLLIIFRLYHQRTSKKTKARKEN